jgi:hypothetical protein
LRKDYYGHGNATLLRDVKNELHMQLGAGVIRKFGTTMIDTDKVMAIVIGAALLGIRNSDIANCEWQIRAGEKLPLEEVGRRALLTRRINDDRCQAKQAISEALKENVETRYFGYGKIGDLTLDVQEPPAELPLVLRGEAGADG